MSIPYMGIKRKLAPKIVNTIFQRHGNKPFYDVFGGGAAVSIEALRYFDEVHYNELDTAIVNLIEQLKIGIPDYWYEPVSREKFFEEIEKDTAYAGMVKTCWSFGNNPRKGYLWGDCAEDKLLLHELCVKNTPELINKARKQIGIELPDKLKGNTIKERRLFLKRIIKKRIDIQSLERLERLERLDTSNKDYQELEIPHNAIIYCDPPYKGTATYKNAEGFEHDSFINWCLEQPNPIYISEYNMPKDFEIVSQFSHISILSATNNAKRTIENLFWNKKGNPLNHKLF